MGIFTRTPKEATAGQPVGEQHAGVTSSTRHRRPTFREWIHLYWIDIATFVVFGAIGLGVYEADPAPTRSFAITFQDGEIVDPEFAYPLRKEIIPIWAAAMIAFFVPFVIFGFCQIRVKSFTDFNAATFGLLYSLINAAVFQVFIKWLIGGLRPHFLAVCQPVIPEGVVGTGFQSIMFDRSVCTGDKNQINDSLESMPSGHSTAAWAGLFFLALYLNAKLKIFADYRPHFWKLIAISAPILGAFLISGALTIDEFHNWYDVVVGGFIGTFSACAAYRMHYASITDFRLNHIPLPPSSTYSGSVGVHGGFPYSSEGIAMYGVQPFTHAAGWANPERPMGGAPGDVDVSAAGATGGGGGGLVGGHHHGSHNVGRNPGPVSV